MRTIHVLRKPCSEGTVAANVLRHGTGAINVDGCRIGTGGERLSCSRADPYHAADGSQRTWNPTSTKGIEREQHSAGRWPANVLHDGSEGVVSTFPANIKGQVGMVKTIGGHRFITGDTETVQQFDHGVSDEGSAARFFQTVRVPSLASDPNEEG